MTATNEASQAKGMLESIEKALKPCSPKSADVHKAQVEADRLRGKGLDLERQIEDDDETELAELRIKISDEVAAGKPATKLIDEAATLKAQIEVKRELLEDLRYGKILAAEQVARQALNVYQAPASRTLRQVRNDHQALITDLAVQMADLVEAWNEALDSWCEQNKPLISGEKGSPFQTAPMYLRFPQIEPHANPARVRTLAEMGEL